MGMDKTHGKMGKHRETHRKMEVYPLVNIQKAMENDHFEWENSLFLW